MCAQAILHHYGRTGVSTTMYSRSSGRYEKEGLKAVLQCFDTPLVSLGIGEELELRKKTGELKAYQIGDGLHAAIDEASGPRVLNLNDMFQPYGQCREEMRFSESFSLSSTVSGSTVQTQGFDQGFDEDTSCEGVIQQPEPMHDSNFTTIMFCCIPCSLNIQDIVDVVDGLGFQDSYDMVYTPTQKTVHKPKRGKKIGNLGYAFINFKEHELAEAFIGQASQAVFSETKSTKVSYAKPAHCQGFDANLLKHSKQRSGCMLTFANEQKIQRYYSVKAREGEPSSKTIASLDSSVRSAVAGDSGSFLRISV
jgi:hypothetical protein